MTIQLSNRLPVSRSSTRFRCRCQCRDCWSRYLKAKYHGKSTAWMSTGRFTLRKTLDKYKRPPKCPHCKSTNIRDIESVRRRELAKQNTHVCAGYPFRHRIGSLRFCLNYLGIAEEPTEDEIHNYEACLTSPRGSTE